MAITPSYSVLDAFTRANESPLSGGGSWTTGIQTASGLRLVSNAVTRLGASGSFGRDGSWYNALTFAAGANCEAGVTIAGVGSDGTAEVFLWNSTNSRGYHIAALMGTFGTGFELGRTGVGKIAGYTTQTPAAGDIIAVQIDGNDIVGWLKRAGTWTEIMRVADTTYRDAFNPGLEVAGFNDVTPAIADDFGAKLLSTAFSKSLSDTITLSDSFSRSAVFGRSFADTITAGDAVTKAVNLVKADTITASDSVVKSVGAKKADTVTLSDAFARTAVFGRSFADTITLSDAAAKSLGLSKADSVTLSDASAKSVGVVKTDSITLSDALAKTLGLSKSDSYTITDAVAKSLAHKLADTVTLSDFMTTSGAAPVNYTLNLADTITLADALTRTLSNSGASPATAARARQVFLNRFGIY